MTRSFQRSKKKPKGAYLDSYLGRCLLQQGMVDEARQCFAHARTWLDVTRLGHLHAASRVVYIVFFFFFSFSSSPALAVVKIGKRSLSQDSLFFFGMAQMAVSMLLPCGDASAIAAEDALPSRAASADAWALSPGALSPELHSALASFASSDYCKAASQLASLDSAERAAASVYRQYAWFDDTSSRHDESSLKTLTHLPTEALNNLAICALYVCDLDRAVQLLEGLVHSDTCTHLNDVTAFNLCTLYDLSSDNPTAAKRKLALQKVAQSFHLDDIDHASFRISA